MRNVPVSYSLKRLSDVGKKANLVNLSERHRKLHTRFLCKITISCVNFLNFKQKKSVDCSCLGTKHREWGRTTKSFPFRIT